jgi:hypothetical protein
MADLADSVWGQHRLAIAEELASWDALDEWPLTNIVIRKTPWLLQTDATPIVIIWQLPERRNREGMIGLSDFRLRAGVAVIRAANQDQELNAGTAALWRQTLLLAFDQTRILATRMDNYMGSYVEPGVPQDAAIFINRNYDAQYFIIQSRVRLVSGQRPVAP